MTGVGVIGAGAWGTALAQLLASDGNHAVRLWARSPGLAQEINQTRANPRYLPGVALHPGVVATSDLGELSGLGVLLLVTPAQAAGAVLAQLPDFAGDLVLCAKGIEAGSGRLMVDAIFCYVGLPCRAGAEAGDDRTTSPLSPSRQCELLGLTA